MDTELKVVSEISEYKGNPMIVLKRDKVDRFPFQFGLSKAKLILAAIPEIEKFVKEASKEKQKKEEKENKKTKK